MDVMAIGDATDRMTKNFDGRFRHMLIVIRCARFAEVLEFPAFIDARFNVRLGFNQSEFAQFLKPSVRTRSDQ
jgi:hypothetical protein